MSDYERNEAANVAAHKYRWVVWGFWPVAFALACIFIPIIVFLRSGKVLEW
jgi:hypothetical protein